MESEAVAKALSIIPELQKHNRVLAFVCKEGKPAWDIDRVEILIGTHVSVKIVLADKQPCDNPSA